MTRRAAPLLIDRLPLYATDKELRAAIFGERANNRSIETFWDQIRGRLPRSSVIFGGRHVPSVLKWFEQYEGVCAPPSPPDGNEREATWKLKRRASASSTGR